MKKVLLIISIILIIGISSFFVNAGVKFNFEDKSFSLFQKMVVEGTQVQEKPAIFFSSPYDELMLKMRTNSYQMVKNEKNVIESKIKNEKKVIKSVSKKTIIKKRVPMEILLTEKQIRLGSIEVKVNQPVIWKNEQEKLQALVYGVREISGMRSGFIQPGESFTWQFSEPGEYTYVDSVVIGRTGKIIVNP